MAGFKEYTGKTVGMDRTNVDTDQIIPKQFLKRIEKTGFGEFLFYDWRYKSNGELNPEFELNLPENQGATILVTNENFGCGSSREHAPWALLDFGFQVIIAPSFADIFYQNCLKNGILPIVLSEQKVQSLLERSKNQPYTLTVSLERQTVSDEEGLNESFEIHPYWKKLLINGWDEIEITLKLDEQIKLHEELQLNK
ncbi:3-isopropylmalate dehydratase small subunit [Mesobacillus harenae]|uniref:3-isopropylmalate dehydratase small subunit n=1 Tax=Mesobacillus harenae TaxID=2213203 RepID=UPI00158019BA|nr:3-isopropylmalate dehydratase small subunit [Mesobacillus harenae]